MPSINDLFSKASAGQRAIATYLTAQKPIGADRINVFDVSTWDNSEPVHFSLYALDANGVRDASTQTDWKGIVAGTSIINIQLRAGTDTVYPVNSPVVATITAGWANDLIQGVTTSIDQDGTLKAGAVDNSDAIANGVVTTPKIATGAVTAAQLAAGSVTNDKIDFSSRPWGFVSYGVPTNGQVVGTGSTDIITFDQLETNGHTGITLPSGGVLQTSVAGVYVIMATLGTIDVPKNNQSYIISAAADGVNFNTVTNYMPGNVDLAYNGRGFNISAMVYLAAGGKVQTIWYNGSANNTRVGGDNKYRAYLCMAKIA